MNDIGIIEPVAKIIQLSQNIFWQLLDEEKNGEFSNLPSFSNYLGPICVK